MNQQIYKFKIEELQEQNQHLRKTFQIFKKNEEAYSSALQASQDNNKENEQLEIKVRELEETLEIERSNHQQLQNRRLMQVRSLKEELSQQKHALQTEKIQHQREVLALQEEIKRLKGNVRRKNDDNLELSRAMNASCLMEARGQENLVDHSNRMMMSQLERSYRPSCSPHRPDKSMAFSRWEGGSKELRVDDRYSQGGAWSKEQLKQMIKATNRVHKDLRDGSRSMVMPQMRQTMYK